MCTVSHELFMDTDCDRQTRYVTDQQVYYYNNYI